MPESLAQVASFGSTMTTDLLPTFIQDNYNIQEWRHACAVLKFEFPEQWVDITAVLTEFRLLKSHLIVGGGRKSRIAAAIDGALSERGWLEKEFTTKVVVDDHEMNSPTHKIDYYKNRIALEIEWNNKDPFFDRDLNNFRLLFDLRTVSVGVIVTRADELQSLVKSLGRGASFGASTTHWSQLIPRIEGGGGGGCPILAFGIRRSLFLDDVPGAEVPARALEVINEE